MMRVNMSAARSLLLFVAVAVATGCPGPTQTEEPKPVKTGGSSSKPKPTSTPSSSATGSPNAGASGSPGPGASGSPSPGATGSPNPGGTASPNPNGTSSPNPNGTASPSASPSAGASASPSASPSAGASASPSASPSSGASASPSASPGASASPSPSPSASATASPTATPAPTATPSGSGTPAPTATPGQAGVENGGIVTTFVGDKDNRGLTDGDGTLAVFNQPAAVAVDGNGNLWVADTGNHAVRKVTPAGTVTLVAGGAQGTNEGSGFSAQFNQPHGIAVDNNGNVYVADTFNHRVRKIAAGGTTTSLFIGGGSGLNGLASPYAVATDRNGNLYIADSGNFRILKVAAGATTATLLAGGATGVVDGTGASAGFVSPSSMTTDFNGNVYVGDSQFLRKITPAGVVTTPTITGATFSQLRVANDRQSDGSVLYASDTDSDKIYMLKRDSNGDYTATVLAGSTAGHADDTGTAARFNDPMQMFVLTDGTIYVPDQGNNVIRKLSSEEAE